MRFISAGEIDGLLTPAAMVEALALAFQADIVTPVRAHHTVDRAPGADATLLLMPAWTGARETAAADGFIGTKIVSVFPDNPKRGKPSVVGVYILFSGETGEPLALMDGPRLTLWRTAGASALAARHLARADASELLMVGAGALSPFLIRAHRAERPITRVRVWNRGRAAAEAVVAKLAEPGLDIAVADDLEAAARRADIVSCATLSSEPLVKGAWLKPGAHLDLVGAFRPTMRESDDEAVVRARLYCDTRAGATHEAGDLADPIKRGVIRDADVLGDLFDLTSGRVAGRGGDAEITLFKSVGTAIEDLAAAMLVWRRVHPAPA